MARAWRLVKTRHLDRVLSGEGAARSGGRWNSPGLKAVYAADSLALAALEILVRIDRAERGLRFSAVPIEMDDRQIVSLDQRLPAGWRASPAPKITQTIGDAWLRAGSALALRLPSAVVPEEFIYLLNPEHRGFPRILPGPARRFEFDPRLLP